MSYFKHQKQNIMVVSHVLFHVHLPIIIITSDSFLKEQVCQSISLQSTLAVSDALLSKQNTAGKGSFAFLCLDETTTLHSWKLATISCCMRVTAACVCSVYVCVSKTCMCALWGIMEGKNTPRCMWCNYILDYLIG